jgi:hypothetical protein
MLSGCGPTKMMRVLNTTDTYTENPKQKFLKVHITDGSLYILDDWENDTITKTIRGTGYLYNFRRDKIDFKPKGSKGIVANTYEICHSDISLIETNQLKNHLGNLAAITIVGVPMAIFSGYCIANPKACFGSCPTFYTLNNDKWNLVAEGFSSSILPVLEKGDIDMLYTTRSSGNNLTVKLTNEALETHVIRYANLLVFPHSSNAQVFSTAEGEFYSISDLVQPQYCHALEGNCLDKISRLDGIERFSLTDSKNLAKKEEMLVSFNNTKNNDLGLIIASRQTLLTTFLFYQGLAYTGSLTGYFISGIENGNQFLEKRVQGLWDKLGGIEICIKNENGRWEKIGEVNEMGPIASDVHLIKLPAGIPRNATIKLKMTQGLWRIDYLALGKLNEKVLPLEILPASVVENDEENPVALNLLNDTTKTLITYPGDSYLLNYKLPDTGDFDFFLHTKGWYLEWIRDEWLKEQNLRKAQILFAFPGLYMRKAAKPFKKTESEMEDRFWGSRYVKN